MKWIRIIFEGKENVIKFLTFEKTIPYNYAYNHLGYSYSGDKSKITVSISSSSTNVYTIVKKWLRNKNIKFKEK